MNADNVVVLTGRLTKDVDLRYAKSGTAIGRFTLAINRSRTELDGTRKADFHNCIIFGKSAEALAKYVSKGSLVGVQGELQDDNYTGNDGVKHYNKQVVVDSFGFRESKKAGSAPQNANHESQNPFEGQGKAVSVDDEGLPF